MTSNSPIELYVLVNGEDPNLGELGIEEPYASKPVTKMLFFNIEAVGECFEDPTHCIVRTPTSEFVVRHTYEDILNVIMQHPFNGRRSLCRS